MSVRTADGPLVATWPLPERGEKQSVRIATSAPAIGEGEENFGTLISQASLRAYEDAGVFANVSADYGSQADIVAEVSLSHRGDFNSLAAQLTGFTLGLIPSSASDYFTVTTVWKNRAGEVIGRAEHTEEVKFWMQLFLVFAMPFTDSDTEVIDQALYDLNARAIQGLVGNLD